MSDRELLEKAAKAAGIRIEGDADKLVVFPGHFAGGFSVFNDKGGSQLWNPLQDDGDGARLEAALDLSVQWQRHHVIVGSHASNRWQGGYHMHGGDKQKARRYAACMAAAAIHDAKGQQ